MGTTNSKPDHSPEKTEFAATKRGTTFAEIMERRVSRRDFLKNAIGGSSMLVIPAALAACAQPAPEPPAVEEEPEEEPTEAAAEEAPTEAAAAEEAPAAEAPAASDIGFEAIEPQRGDTPVVPAGYMVTTLIRWGDPLTEGGPEFDSENLSADAQSQQFGYNNDMVAFFPLPMGSNASDRGILAVNHEYTNTDLIFRDYDFEAGPTQEQADYELAAHGVTMVEVQRDEDGNWSYNPSSQYNRRITTRESEATLTGPAAGDDMLKTSEDDTGTRVIGTINNCAGGKTPWGTYVTAEENFHQYFSNAGQLEDDDPVKAIHERYGVPEEASRYQWSNVYDRWDVTKEPNEPLRFGWLVEIDPYDAEFVPRKRTALGRFRHEAATFVVAPDNRVVAYTGDDARFEYVYKFVSEDSYNPDDREANMDLLDNGTLYVAKFNEDGTGEWLPLIFGEGPLTEENGFTSQADVLIRTRFAADALGATQMDRPEDIEPNPVNQKVYIALTNNTRREEDQTDAANPRPENRYGHIIELTEDGDDHAATTFAWEIFLLCGNPEDESTYFAGFDKELVSPISNPDNITFDNAGNLWIATDGQPGTLGTTEDDDEPGFNDAFFVCPVSGPERGYVRQFFSSVAGSEVCGPEFTPDNTTVFLAIQHPGDGGTFEDPVSTWPDGEVPPRPSIVAIQAEDGRAIGA